MKNIKLSGEERSEMRRFYMLQLEESLRNVRHLNSILDKLGPAESEEIVQPKAIENPTLKNNSLISSTQITPSSDRKKGTRGRKSLWGNFILNQLQEQNRPLSYTEIINTAVDKFNLPESKVKNVKQAITNSAFRLRVINKKIDTYGLSGKKERYLCLSNWFEHGKLKSIYIKELS